MYKKEYYDKNKGRILEQHKIYRQNHPNYIKIYWQKNKERLRRQNNEYRTKNKAKIKLIKKIYYEKNKERIKLKEVKAYYKNILKIKSKKKEYYLKNKVKLKKLHKRFYLNHPDWKKQNYHHNKNKILSKRKIDRKIYPEKWKKWELNYKNRKKFVDSLRHNLYKEIENKRRAQLGLPFIGEKYKKEYEMKLYLDKLLKHQEYKNNGRYEWLNGMELDRYYPKLKLAFEYNGEQHFHQVAFFKINVEEIKKRDKLKRELCKKNGVMLIEIFYLEKINEQLILSKLKNLNLPIQQENLIKRN